VREDIGVNTKIAEPVKLVTFVAALLAARALLLALPAEACSRVFVNDNKIAKIVVRSMDLPLHQPERPRLVVFPRGMQRDCTRSVLPGVPGNVEGLGKNPLKWTSKHGSVVMTGFDAGTSDGINECGLAAHLLTLIAVRHEPRDDRPELTDGLWVQYVLDNFQTVKEVVQAHQEGKFRLVAATAPALGLNATLGSHLAVEDPTGDSAIVEYVAGALVIHHGPQYTVMTNDPPLGEMLKRMKKYKAFGGTQALPGESMEGESRFARLAAYQKLLPEPRNSQEALAAAFSLLRIAQIPFRDPEKDQESEPEALWRGCQTTWVSAADLTHKVYYIHSPLVLNLGWVELTHLNFGLGAPILFVDPHDPQLGGDLTGRFKQWKRP
jgi:choloylglycine hydrolase